MRFYYMEQEKKENIKWLGVLLTLIGAVCGLLLHLLFFLMLYDELLALEVQYFPNTSNVVVIKYILPLFTDFGILAGVIYTISAVGFLNKKDWAYGVATVANVIALQFSFWPTIPMLDLAAVGVPFTPYYLIIFVANTIIFFTLHLVVGKRPGRRVIAALVSGMTLVTAWINGTACVNLTLMKPDNVYYIMANRLHWLTAIVFAVVTVGILLAPKKTWVPMLGLGFGILEIVLGTPMGIETTLEKGEFSMFLAAPIFSGILLLIFLIPPLYREIIRPERDTIGGKSWMI
ncbi:MAG: hypothetical protein ACTSYI_07205 [Promethearchaeota archaeon]